MRTKSKKPFSKLLSLAVIVALLAGCLLIPSTGFAGRTIYVSTATELKNALSNAQPGDTIIMNPGTYVGNFKCTANGTASAKIILKSTSQDNKAILKGNGTSSGYGLHITGDYWEIQQVKITNSQKGVVLDNANHCVLHGVTVYDVGMEGIHFRDGSSNNTAKYCKVYNTGKVNAGYGEGFYVGTDYADWDKYNRACNNNTIFGCTIGEGVTAEHFDIKEGTFGTTIYNNTCLGKGISGEHYADSFIDNKGRNVSVYNNTFYKQNNSKITASISETKRPVDPSLTANGSISDTSDGNTYTNNTTYSGNP